MTLKKFLNALATIDPDGKISDFVYSLTYLEARALKDLMIQIDEDFYNTRNTVMKKVKGIHTKSAIYQYQYHDIEDLHVKVEIGNAKESIDHSIQVPFVGIKIAFIYEGLETPINVYIKSCDKEVKGFIDEQDWASFFEMFIETLTRYIKIAKKGAPKFEYKKSGKTKKSRLKDNNYDNSNPFDINAILNDPDIKNTINAKMQRNIPAISPSVVRYNNGYTKTTEDYYLDDKEFISDNYDDYYVEEYDNYNPVADEYRESISNTTDMPEDIVEDLKTAVAETKSEESENNNSTIEESIVSTEENTSTIILDKSSIPLTEESKATTEETTKEEEVKEENNDGEPNNPKLILVKGKKRRK